MKRVIIDTNALIAIHMFKLDVFSAIEESLDIAYEVCIIDGTLKELEKLKTSRDLSQKERNAAKLALSIVQKKLLDKTLTLLTDDPTMDVDSNLAEESAGGALILTQDKGLKMRLTKPYLTIRQQKRVVVIE